MIKFFGLKLNIEPEKTNQISSDRKLRQKSAPNASISGYLTFKFGKKYLFNATINDI
jgi:hypothetical protein